MALSLGFLSKFKNKKSFQGGKRYTFVILALVLLVIVGLFVVYSFTFLISVFSDVSGPQPASPTPLRFDIQGFEKLNLTK